MYCSECGTHNADNAKTCDRCGRNLTIIPAELEVEVAKTLDSLNAAKNAVDAQAERVEEAKEIAQTLQKSAFRAERTFKDERHILIEKTKLAASAEAAYMATKKAYAIASAPKGKSDKN